MLFVFGLAFRIISQVFTWDLLFERGLLVVISANLWNKRWPPFIHHMVESRIRRVDSAIDDLGRDRKKNPCDKYTGLAITTIRTENLC